MNIWGGAINVRVQNVPRVGTGVVWMQGGALAPSCCPAHTTLSEPA